MSESLRILWILCVLEAAVALPAAMPAGSEERPPPGSIALPPAFVENRGQWPEDVRFASIGGSLVAAFRKDGIAIAAGPLELTFEGARGDVAIEGEGAPAGTYTFLHGRDRSRWRSGARAYRSILWRGIHDCVDLRLREGPPEDGRRTLEYDLILEPGADPRAIAVRCDGAEGLALEEDGSLAILTPLGVLRQLPPRTWQELPSGERIPVECRHVILDERRFGFEVAPADPSLPVTIDPPLVWATYLGGWGDESVQAVALDRDGGVLVAGDTASPSFPCFEGGAIRGDFDNFVAKLSADGTSLPWCVVFGGTCWSSAGSRGWDGDALMAMGVDGEGVVTVGGWTCGADFPLTDGAIQSELAGPCDAFLTRFRTDPSLSVEEQLVSSTLLGGAGDEAVTDLAIDAIGAIVACGFTTSADFPRTSGAFQESFQGGSCDAWVARLAPDPANPASGALRLEYSTYLGGPGDDGLDDPQNRLFCQALALEPSGAVTVTGITFSTDFPTTEGAYSRSLLPGDHSMYISRLVLDAGRPPEEQLVYSTFLGGSMSEGPLDILVDVEGAIIVTGITWSSDYPTTPGAYDTTFGGGNEDVFLTRLVPDPALAPGEQLDYSTYLGGNGYDDGYALGILGKTVLVAGNSSSKDFPISPGAIVEAFTGQWAGFLSCLRLDRSLPPREQLLYSTFLAASVMSWGTAIVADSDGSVLVGGVVVGSGLPVTPEAFQSQNRGAQDAFVARLDLRLPTAEFTSSQDGASVCVDGTSSTTPEGTTIDSWAWDFGDGETDQVRTPPCHVYDCPGIYPITLTVTSSLGLVATKSQVVTVRCDEGDDVVAPWTAADIGAPRYPGSASQDGDCFALCAGGLLLDFSGRADDLHFVEKEIAGDFSLVLRIEEMDGASLGEQPGAQLGLMARETLDPGSAMAAVSIRRVGSGSPDFRWNSRAALGATVRSRSCLDEDCPAAGVPGWVRLERKGDDLIGAVSADGRTWAEPEGWTLALPAAPAALRVGIFGTSREPIDVRRAFEALRGRACLAEPGFIRGDCNQDGKVDISDAVCILEWLFLGGEASTCADAADANDDGSVNISDPISLLGFLFLGGAPPAAPFPGCGADPSEDDLGCESFAGCP